LSLFYLHQQVEGGLIEDPDGTEAVNLAAVKLETIKASRQLIANAILNGTIPLAKAFQITDAFGTVLAVVSLREALPPGLCDLG